MSLSTLTLPELLRHAWASHDELTATDLQTELLKRLEQIQDTHGELIEFAEIHFQPGHSLRLLQLCREAEADTPDELQRALGHAARLQACFANPDEGLTALHTLAKSCH